MSWAAAVVAVLTLLRLLVAARTPLSPDEAYYWTWSRALAPCYLDHPPMVAFWIRIGTGIAGDNPLGVRLLAPLAASLGSVLAARAARDLLGLGRERRIATVMLLNATLMVGAGAVIMTPDTPLLFFWTLALWFLGRFVATGSDRWLVGAFAAVGLAFDSKYTGFLLVPPIAAFLLLGRDWRSVLASRPIWAACAAGLLVVLPVVAWNARHGFASFVKQGGRAGDIHLAAAVRFLPELVIGQFALATPLIAILFCVGVWQVALRGLAGDKGAALVAFATLLPAAVFIEHAFGDRVQANWPAVLYPSAAMAAAACTLRRLDWRPAALLGGAITLLVYAQAALHPFTLPGRLDVTRARFGGWQGLSREVRQIDRSLGDDPVAADDYALAAELAWHGAARPLLGLERRWSFVRLPRVMLGNTPVLLIRTTRRGPPDPRLWTSMVPVANLARGGSSQAEHYLVYRATAAAGITAARLPEPHRPAGTGAPP